MSISREGLSQIGRDKDGNIGINNLFFDSDRH
jgi:hypothetical protein